MIKTVDSTSWSVEDLTGGGCYVETDPVNGVIFLVSPVRSDNTFAVLKSTNFGATWSQIVSWTHPFSTRMSEPQVAFDPSSHKLFITTTTDNSQGTNSLLLFSLNTTSGVLSSPLSLLTGQKIKSAYSICIDNLTKEVVVVASVSEPLTPVVAAGKYALVEFVCTQALAITNSRILTSSPLKTGDTYGSVQILSPTSGGIEISWVQHPRMYTFQPRISKIFNTFRNTTWSDFTSLSPIYSYSSEFNDDKFTVVKGQFEERFLCHLWYTRTNVPLGNTLVSQISSTVLLGYRDTLGGQWSWSTLAPSDSTSLVEPTLSFKPYTQGLPMVTLACLSRDLSLVDPSGTLRVFDWDPTTMSTTSKFPRLNNLRFTWLRGTVGAMDSKSSWSTLGMLELDPSSTLPTYLSSFNLPPVPSFTVSTHTVRRNLELTLDASATMDPDRDSLTYRWSLSVTSPYISLTPIGDGTQATLFVSNDYGPSQGTFYVILKVQDFDENGLPINAPVTTSQLFTIPFNSPQIINWYSNPVQSDRNQIVVLDPFIIDPDGDSLTYSWIQTKGTLLDSSQEGSSLTINTAGASVLGETIQFQLNVDDNVNSTTSSLVDVIVPPIKSAPALIDYNYLYRTFLQSPTDNSVRLSLSHRNSSGTYTDLSKSLFTSDFNQTRTSINLNGDRRYLFISPRTCLVLGDSQNQSLLYKKMFLPDQEYITSAWLTEKDSLLIIGTNKLFNYDFSKEGMVSDSPDKMVDLEGLWSGIRTLDILVPPVSGGSRAVLIATARGILALQLNEDTWAIEDRLIINLESHLLYGANNVEWMRISSVEGLRFGKILVGTKDPISGDSFETLIDLSTRRIAGVWDKTKLINDYPVIGEILYDTTPGYYGSLMSPVIDAHRVSSVGLTFGWEQQRPDLVDSYEVQMSQDGSSWGNLDTIWSGSIQVYTYRSFSTAHDYLFRVRSINRDGPSPWSNELEITQTPSTPPAS